MDIRDCREIAGSLWCHKKFSNQVMDINAAEAIAWIIYTVAVKNSEEGLPESNDLDWEFDGDGEWMARSRFHDDGQHFCWIINVTDGGFFSINRSTTELLPKKDIGLDNYACLQDAKDYCQSQEE